MAEESVSFEKLTPDEVEQAITDFEKRLVTPGNIDYIQFHSKSPRKESFLTWGKLLEVKFKRENKSPTLIMETIRHKLKDLGLQRLYSYAYEVLPHTYKNPHYIHNTEDLEARSVEHTDNSSILLAEDCKRLNTLTLSRVQNSITALSEFAKRLRSDVTFEMDVDENTLEELFIKWDQCNSLLEQTLDKREKITPSTHHLLFFAGTTETLSNVYEVYVKHVKDFANVTPKQVGKILKGRTKKVNPLYDPKSKYEAMTMGFYGSQCKECGSWRMESKLQGEKYKTQCFKCGFKQTASTEYYNNE